MNPAPPLLSWTQPPQRQVDALAQEGVCICDAGSARPTGRVCRPVDAATQGGRSRTSELAGWRTFS
eukprot:3582679-Prymnesium_polylepis.2